MRRRGIWLAPLLVLGLTSCGEPAATGAPDVGADAYVAAISEFLPPAPVDESEAKPVVFITPVGTEPLSLDDQVAMIDLLSFAGSGRLSVERKVGVIASIAQHHPVSLAIANRDLERAAGKR